MKNISRRVFIKGLAVAGVAAAASTVLAGCNTNMIPGVDDGEGEVEVPSTSGVLEYTDKTDDKITVKVSALGMTLGTTAFSSEEAASIKLKIENDLGQKLPILKADPAINTSTSGKSVLSDATKIKQGEYYILAEAYNDGNKNNAATVVTTGGLAKLSSNAPADPAANKETTVDYLYLEDVTAKQNVTLKLTLKKCVKVSSAAAGLISTLAEQTYTFNV